MDIAAEKDRLKKEIDKINDPSVLAQISEFLSDSEDTSLSEEQLKIVMEERERYTKDPSILESWENFSAKIRKGHEL